MSLATMLVTKKIEQGTALPTNVCTGRTFQATVRGKGNCTATITLEYTNDQLVWFPVPDSPKTVTCTGANGVVTVGGDIFDIFNEGWAYMRAGCTAISGTDAEVIVTMSIV